MGTPFKNNFMRCYAGGDPGRSSPVGQVGRATLAPFLYPLLFYQKSGQKSIILCVANLTNGRKNRRNTAPQIVQYDELHSLRPGILRRQEHAQHRQHQRQHRHAVAESRAGAAERRRPYSSAGRAAGAAEHKRSGAGKASSRGRAERERRAPRPADHRQPQSREAGTIQPQGAADDPGSIRKRSQTESVRQPRERREGRR